MIYREMVKVDESEGCKMQTGRMTLAWVRQCLKGAVVLFVLSVWAEHEPPEPFVRVSLVEYNAMSLEGSSQDSNTVKALLEQYRDGRGTVVFSCAFTAGGRKTYTDTQWLLVPMGFQRPGVGSRMPNPMNFTRRGLGTRISIRDFDARPVHFTLEREYMVGLEAARSATPETFIEPVARTVKFDFEVPSTPGDSVAGGGWHEDTTNKVYYVIVSGTGR